MVGDILNMKHYCRFDNESFINTEELRLLLGDLCIVDNSVAEDR